jgi:hypothetical protein
MERRAIIKPPSPKAHRPTLDGSGIVVVGYSSIGCDIVKTPFGPDGSTTGKVSVNPPVGKSPPENCAEIGASWPDSLSSVTGSKADVLEANVGSAGLCFADIFNHRFCASAIYPLSAKIS